MLQVRAHARLLIAAMWAGSLWTIGYLVAPTLFATLTDRVLAGSIAGSLFGVQAWLSIFCAITLVFLLMVDSNQINVQDRNRLFKIIIAMLVCVLIAHFGLQPMMAELRSHAGTGGVMISDSKQQFGILHGLSSVIYLVQSLLAGLLVVTIR